MKQTLIGLVAGLLLSGAIGAHAGEGLTIRVGWVNVPNELTPILFAKPGIAKHQGVSYVFVPMHYDGTPLMTTALAAGELDIASFAFSSFGLAVLNAGMDDLRIIADGIEDGVPGYYSGDFLVRRDSSIRTIEDLKGKVLAPSVFGAVNDITIRAMLRQHHLDDKKDVTMVEVKLPNMKAMLAERKVDLISSVPPFVYDPELQEMSRRLFTVHDTLGKTQMTAWTAREDFLKKNRAALVDFLEDEIRALHWYLDPKNHDEMARIVADFTKLPPARLVDWVLTKRDYYHDPDGVPDLQALQRNLDTETQLGLLKAAVDVQKHADLSLVKEAGKRLE